MYERIQAKIRALFRISQLRHLYVHNPTLVCSTFPTRLSAPCKPTYCCPICPLSVPCAETAACTEYRRVFLLTTPSGVEYRLASFPKKETLTSMAWVALRFVRSRPIASCLRIEASRSAPSARVVAHTAPAGGGKKSFTHARPFSQGRIATTISDLPSKL